MEIENEEFLRKNIDINTRLRELDLFNYFVNIYPPNKGTYAM